MKRLMAVTAAVMVSAAVLHADVTVVQTTKVEGGPAGMMGANAGMTMTMFVKGTKMRSEAEMMGNRTAFIVDAATKQMFMLNPADKTARAVDAANPIVPKGTQMPNIDVSFKPTGQTRTIDGVACDEYAVQMAMDMASMGGPGGQMPPEAAEMMKDVKMVIAGSSWIAKNGPGISEFAAYQQAIVKGNMAGVMSGIFGAGNTGMDKVMAASAQTAGLPYLTEMTMSVEGTGQFVDMMKQMGPMKITTKVTSVSTAPIADEQFTVPADYKTIK